MAEEKDSKKWISDFLKVTGLILILLGVLFLISSLICWFPLDGMRLSIIFFMMMIGFAFVYPDLLRDQNNGISTMRLVVFMMINVICILLLQIGWGQTTLKNIGLDWNWMGVIAFVFGAKATQAFFEAKYPPPAGDGVLQPEQPNNQLGSGSANDQIIQAAIDQNANTFNAMTNKIAVMHGKMMKQGQLTDCITVHLSDSQTTGYPPSVTVKPDQGDTVMIDVDYIVDVTPPKAQVGNGSVIGLQGNTTSEGSVCCRLFNSSQNAYYLLTCNHVMTGGRVSAVGKISPAQPAAPTGNWVWGSTTSAVDAALIAIDSAQDFSYKYSQETQPRALTSNDMLTTDITMFGTDGTNLKVVTGKITNYNSILPITVGFPDGNTVDFNNLIVLSQVTNNNGENIYKTLSNPGDSGSLICDQSNTPIAMVIAGNNQFTYAIPLNVILQTTQTTIA